jgi:hypothetical protein
MSWSIVSTLLLDDPLLALRWSSTPCSTDTIFFLALSALWSSTAVLVEVILQR